MTPYQCSRMRAYSVCEEEKEQERERKERDSEGERKEIHVMWHMKSFQIEWNMGNVFGIKLPSLAACANTLWFDCGIGCHANILHNKFNIISHLFWHYWDVIRFFDGVPILLHVPNNAAPHRIAYTDMAHPPVIADPFSYENWIWNVNSSLCMQHIKCLFQFSTFNNTR